MRSPCGLLLLLAGGASALEVEILKPDAGRAVFGRVEVVASLQPDGAPIERVVFFLDGRRIGERVEPPYRLEVDVGEENRRHEFRVMAFPAEGAPADATLTTPRVHIDDELTVELQQLYVTVTTGGRRVLDLRPEELEIRDNGKPQRLVTFSGGEVPLAAALLLDSSRSMQGAPLEAALTGARTFVEEMRELDEAAAFLFSHGLLRATPFTTDAEVLKAALDDIEADGNTSLNDHLYVALKHLDTRQGRRVAILLSDGADLHSVLGMREVLWKARRSQAMIYWIRLEEGGKKEDGGFHTAWRDYEANRAELELLEETVRTSGGRIVGVDRASGIEPAFQEILAELREQYVLGFYPSEVRNDGSWHAVRVRVRRPGTAVRTRNGYVDF